MVVRLGRDERPHVEHQVSPAHAFFHVTVIGEVAPHDHKARAVLALQGRQDVAIPFAGPRQHYQRDAGLVQENALHGGLAHGTGSPSKKYSFALQL